MYKAKIERLNNHYNKQSAIPMFYSIPFYQTVTKYIVCSNRIATDESPGNISHKLLRKQVL